MADAKVSELTVATSVAGSDLFYLVQGNSSKKVTAATLFSNAGNATLTGNVSYGAAYQQLSSPGIVDITKTVTHLNCDGVGGTIAVPSGKELQVKIIVMTTNAGGTMTINANIANNANVIFNNVGDTAQLLFTNNKWFVIGGTATLT